MIRVIILAMLLAACTPASTPPTSHLVQGTMTLHDKDSSEAVDEFGRCSGQGGYADLEAGAAVTVKDQAGTLIATGSLDPGSPDDLENTCTFRFTLLAVPDAGFYSIELGRRGALSYSRAEMEAMGWAVGFTLGD